jgi:hypothetical protein
MGHIVHVFARLRGMSLLQGFRGGVIISMLKLYDTCPVPGDPLR